ncbi:uncharacterized protein M421DRAFT_4995 [Didymella exigua CBS 183.55]|uniref:DUF7918 domain-containing protein n=1 Tax=Didymella exigua CBS 183.55 TaxID=1150837 RepID=A0A6A5RQE4_9PLEO|nr:uncharacterized protein M421DRAFT_4995 [Didymella exigua CBS 183.55]KAF1928526.1 hypothetical protein M421DRAFT_4995 [Didymella exigua CBS 183.55]
MTRKKSDTVASKYIEAVSGAEFAVQWKISSPWPPATILFEYWLDQKKVGGRYCKQELYKRPAYIYLMEGARTVVNGQEFVHKFAFAALDVGTRCWICTRMDHQLIKDLKGMGEITVKAWFVKNLQTLTTVDHSLSNRLKEVGKIPEKALKGCMLSHQTSLRAPQVSGNAASQASREFLDPEREPFATYTFKYRSRDVLKSLLIIPRTPSPVPLEQRDIDTLTAEEMREVLCQQRVRDEASQPVKQERGVKREHARARSSTYTDDSSDEVSFVSASKRHREHYRTTVDEDGTEAIDLT